MSTSYRINDQYKPYFMTLTVIKWIDLFTRPAYKNLITDALNYAAEQKKLQIFCWVLMTNHLHIIAQADGNLSEIIGAFKSYTSKQLFRALNEQGESRREWLNYFFRNASEKHSRNQNFQIWKHDYHAITLSDLSSEIIDTKINYIHENPVRAGIVEYPEQYLYSSARDYQDIQGLVKIIKA